MTSGSKVRWEKASNALRDWEEGALHVVRSRKLRQQGKHELRRLRRRIDRKIVRGEVE